MDDLDERREVGMVRVWGDGGRDVESGQKSRLTLINLCSSDLAESVCVVVDKVEGVDIAEVED